MKESALEDLQAVYLLINQNAEKYLTGTLMTILMKFIWIGWEGSNVKYKFLLPILREEKNWENCGIVLDIWKRIVI